ncbi:hypothetical protein [Pleomorphovibrio marinus]|uniref:hypothetical protein n=1 Tax=Pleomorphovibrio marinus TaxID=2164132 RepID=UPI000E0C2655|nr:hypothetical protein [Pleomorphovibrio marinus]
MSNFNPIRYVGALALLGFAACNTSQRAMQGESDNLYFMASDARVATEFAVKNNNPENFRDIEEIRSVDVEQDNFSARNVNPDYIAKYQRSQQPAEEGSVYFDDSQTQDGGDLPQGNLDAYDNFRGSGNNGRGVTNNFFMNPMMGMGMGWGMPMMGMGMWDPFWGPGMGMMGMGMRPGFNMSIGMGMGWGGGFGNPWMMRPGFGMGMGWGNPWMMRPGFGMMGMGMWDPFWGPGMGMGMWGPGMGMGMWGRGFYNPVIVVPGGEIGRRQMVAAQRPTRGSSLAGTTASPRSRGDAVSPGSSRANARRQAVASSPNARQRAATNTRNSFARSQNDLNTSPRASASPARRNLSSPAAGRAGSPSTRSAYAAPSTTRSSAARAATPSSYNTRSRAAQTQRSGYAAPNRRGTSPSYNRGGATRSTSPSMNRRSTAPSYQQRSAPSRTSSPSRSFSAPSRGGYSGGGASRGASVGGGRRGN